SEKEIRVRYQSRWRYLSVDEYQDVNDLQVQWLTLLVGPEKNICAVGDDYQAIYSWRGGSVDYLLNFEREFPGCKTLYLTQNYRSTTDILSAANAVIAENVVQKHKRLWTLRQAQSKPVKLAAHLSDRAEARWVREEIAAYVDSGGSLRDCAVLYRTNAQSRAFEEEFLSHEMPYTIVGGFRFYERREIKDALALLTLLVNQQATLAIERVAGALWRGVGPKTIKLWEQAAEAKKVPVRELVLQEAGRRPVMERVARAYHQAFTRPFATVAEVLEVLLTQTGYWAWLAQQGDFEERKANLEELLNVTSVYTDVTTFLEAVALLTDLDRHDGDAERVTCMTLHAAKGLEFGVVFIVGCEEGLLPHMNSLASRSQLEEERRLLYVGMTRAKEKLVLSYAQYRFIRGQRVLSIPSRFLKSLPDTIEQVDPAFQPSLRLPPAGAEEVLDEEFIDYSVPL
ncbi:MAG: 3'-5' exonuclease, partial [Patescibacteria group bacterium]